MAAEVIASAGHVVAVVDAMPSVGRKFLLAGVGGMNITHAEPFEKFVTRYGDAQHKLMPHLNAFTPTQLREWIHGLGIETFVGSSDRVFPTDMKAAPLLRAWLHRLKQLGVQFFARHRWCGFDASGAWLIENGQAEAVEKIALCPSAVVLALGGASWQRLGSNGAWVPWLREKQIEVVDFQPSNVGFCIEWSSYFREQSAGSPLHGVGVKTTVNGVEVVIAKGEVVVADYGIEGTSIYAISAQLRNSISQTGTAHLVLDLIPEKTSEQLVAQLNKPQGKNSTSNFLRKSLNLSPIKIALLREVLGVNLLADKNKLAKTIKSLPLTLTATRPIDEAISCAGGVAWNELTNTLMLTKLPSVFCAGEMLDWEAPTGGYLLTACFATGKSAGEGVVKFLKQPVSSSDE